MANVNMNIPSVHLSDIAPRTGFLAGWDRQRHHKFHWFAECFAEAVSDLLDSKDILGKVL